MSAWQGFLQAKKVSSQEASLQWRKMTQNEKDAYIITSSRRKSKLPVDTVTTVTNVNNQMNNIVNREEVSVDPPMSQWGALRKGMDQIHCAWIRQYKARLNWDIAATTKQEKLAIRLAISRYGSDSKVYNKLLESYKNLSELAVAPHEPWLNIYNMPPIMIPQIMWLTPGVSMELPIGFKLFEGRSRESLIRNIPSNSDLQPGSTVAFNRPRATSTSTSLHIADKFSGILSSYENPMMFPNILVHEIVSGDVRAIDMETAKTQYSEGQYQQPYECSEKEFVLQPFLHFHVFQIFEYGDETRIIHCHVYSKDGDCPKCHLKSSNTNQKL